MIFYILEFLLEIFIMFLLWKFWLNKKPKKNKILAIFLICLSFIIPFKTKALTLSDNTELPDPPTLELYNNDITEPGSELGYIIIQKNNTIFLFTITNGLWRRPNYTNINYNYINGTNNQYWAQPYRKFNLINNEWIETNTNLAKNLVPWNDYVLYSSIDIYEWNLNEIIIPAGYGLQQTTPEPTPTPTPTPEPEPLEDPKGIINKIAEIYKNIYEDLIENNIEFYQILIGLLVFNFVLFELCYITRAFIIRRR